MLVTAILYLLCGAVLLFLSAHYFLDSAIAIGEKLGWSNLCVGVVIVGGATALPEIVVSVLSALYGHTHLAIGNALGSYIINIGFVIGLSALLRPLSVHPRLIKRDLPILVLTLLLTLYSLQDTHLSHGDAYGFLVMLGIYGLVLYFSEKKAHTPINTSSITSPLHSKRVRQSFWRIFMLLVCSLTVLLFSADLMVKGAINLTKHLGISSFTIGVTVLAIGTSLPELAASLLSAWRKQPDIALGNVMGSNTLGILAILAVSGLLQPSTLPMAMRTRELPFMSGATLLLCLLLCRWKKGQSMIRITRIGGFCCLLLFIGYITMFLRK